MKFWVLCLGADRAKPRPFTGNGFLQLM